MTSETLKITAIICQVKSNRSACCWESAFHQPRRFPARHIWWIWAMHSIGLKYLVKCGDVDGDTINPRVLKIVKEYLWSHTILTVDNEKLPVCDHYSYLIRQLYKQHRLRERHTPVHSVMFYTVWTSVCVVIRSWVLSSTPSLRVILSPHLGHCPANKWVLTSSPRIFNLIHLPDLCATPTLLDVWPIHWGSLGET